jgi:hypothetical protein
LWASIDQTALQFLPSLSASLTPPYQGGNAVRQLKTMSAWINQDDRQGRSLITVDIAAWLSQ